MKLYHGSKDKFEKIERRQAMTDKSVQVPESELQNKIYFTPDIGFALAMAVRPKGITHVDNGYISFENIDDFDPECTIYVYEIESESIEEDLVEQVDNEQFAVDMDYVRPAVTHEFKAKDVFEYYELSEWVHPNEQESEFKFL